MKRARRGADSGGTRARRRANAGGTRARTRRAGSAAAAVGVDTGGTFTDVVTRRGGRLEAVKLLSTPRAPEQAVLAGLAAAGATRGTRVGYGSTVATNALLERKGARVVLVTTAGFEDVLEIGRQDRPDLYALAPRRVPPLVPAARRIGARERIGPDGRVRTPLTRRELARVRAAVARAKPEAIAIGLLHAYGNDVHERRLARALAAPRAGAPRVPVTRASALVPEIREVERLATTVVNAYLAPRVTGMLARLARGTPARVEVMLSHGGTAPPVEASREPVRQLLSGPAAGLLAAARVATACGWPRALTLDVGGTSTDVAHVEGDGALPRRRGREIGGFPILLPVLDVHTVGAGGGSIARVDAGGMLHAGPDSAGADPGPACYGRGGPATVTDAQLVLGRIAGATLAGGVLRLDGAAAERALRPLARALGVRTVEDAALGVLAVADARMAAALRRVSVERAHDPRGAALVAFGGAGGLHACALAAELGAAAVLFPPLAGVLSALGALAAGARRERSRTVLLDVRDGAALERAWRPLEREAWRALPAAERRGATLERWAEVRYRGQSHELSLMGRPLATLAARFHREHERRHGFANPNAVVEAVTIEARAAAPDRWPASPPRRARAAVRPERVRVHDGRGWRTCERWRFEELPRVFAARGPAVVAQDGATLWVPPNWGMRMHAGGTLVVRPGSPA